ncbi:hypothetical protein C8R46DRAFT_34396 [Mycena filopes]|nr:hypothetical protein C8R46DRAFT_34396 [Mycena filopes]
MTQLRRFFLFGSASASRHSQSMMVPPASPPPNTVSIIDVEFAASSPEVPAVMWVLETSTDPSTITSAADITLDLQWPDFTPQTTRLRETLLACFEYSRDSRSCWPNTFWLKKIRDGMEQRAIQCIHAYCLLRASAHRQLSIFSMPNIAMKMGDPSHMHSIMHSVFWKKLRVYG